MKVHNEEIQQRLGFIDRTIFHAVRACHSDGSVPDDMREYVQQLGEHSSRAQEAVCASDARGIRQSVDELACTSFEAQNRLHEEDGVNFELKSAVILTHIELSALRHQLD